jgi:hypothetical protein
MKGEMSANRADQTAGAVKLLARQQLDLSQILKLVAQVCNCFHRNYSI